jgi:hypothetical protein
METKQNIVGDLLRQRNETRRTGANERQTTNDNDEEPNVEVTATEIDNKDG